MTDTPTRTQTDPMIPGLLDKIAQEEARAQNARRAGQPVEWDGPAWPWWIGAGA